MIIGCPDNFAIYCDKINCWSLNGYIEGLMGFFINGKVFPKNFYDYTISIDSSIKDLKEVLFSDININSKVFRNDKLELIKYLLKKRYPAHVFNSEDEYNSYPDNLYQNEHLNYSINVELFQNSRLACFVVKNGNFIRLLILEFQYSGDFFDLSKIKKDKVEDIIIDYFEFKEIIEQLERYFLEKKELKKQKKQGSNDSNKS